MPEFAAFQRTIVDDDGNIMPGATVEVRDELTGALPSLYSDRTGTGKDNPFQADGEGFAYFHVVGGVYKITASSGATQRIWRYVGIGLTSESDVPPISDALSHAVNGGL